MSSWMIWLPLGLAVVYIGLPMLIYSSQKIQAQPGFVPIDPSNVPSNVNDFFSRIVPQLEKIGFRTVVALGMPNSVPNVESFLVFLVNRSEGDKAMVTVIVGKSAEGTTNTTMYLEYSTRFSSGEMFDTINSSVIGTFKRGPKNIKTQLPSVQDPAALYQIHRFVMSQNKVGGSKIMPADGESVSFLSKVVIESYEEQVAFRRLYLNAAEGVYRPTLLGAFAMTWPLLWPMSFYHRAKMKAKEKVVLRKFQAQRGTNADFRSATTGANPWS